MLVDKLKKEFEINDEWVGFEIHPDVPSEGVSISRILPKYQQTSILQNLSKMGSLHGIEFANVDLLPNSRLAHEASLYAKECNKFDKFHDGIFNAYFSQGRNIGDIEVLLDIGRTAGLDISSLRDVLQAHKYLSQVKLMKKEASGLGITAVPTFIIEKERYIIGTQSIDIFKKVLREYQR